MIKGISLFFLFAVSACFFGTISYGAEPKQCDITHYVLQERVAGALISDTLRRVQVIAVKVYGEEARDRNSVAWLATENMVRVGYGFDYQNARKALKPALAAGCEKFLAAKVDKVPALK